MRKLLLITFLLASLESKTQTIIRVVNGQNLQTVMDAAIDNSTIIVEGGNYGNIVFNKPLKLYGTGYFLDGVVSNTGLQASTATSVIGNIEFGLNSSNSEMQGISANEIIITSNQISIKRNKFSSLTIGSQSGGVSNILITQNIFDGFVIYSNSSGTVFRNNIIKGDGQIKSPVISTFLNNSFVGGNKLLDVQGNTGIFNNNIFYADIRVRECYGATFFNMFQNTQNQFINNIWGTASGNSGGNCNLFYYPITLNASNKVNQDYSTIYTQSLNLTEDARYQLSPNSPAKGAGENGTDAGAFGGDEPYILSGIPSIPTIYELTVPTNVPQGGTLNVQIKAKTNN